MQRKRLRVQVPAEDSLLSGPARVPLSHFLDRSRLLTMLRVRIRQGPENFIDGSEGGSHHSLTLVVRLGHEDKVVDLNVNLGDGWPSATAEGRGRVSCVAMRRRHIRLAWRSNSHSLQTVNLLEARVAW